MQGINPKDIEELDRVGGEIDAARQVGEIALGNLQSSIARETNNPKTPLTAEERRLKEIEAFYAEPAQKAESAGARLLAGRPPEAGKRTFKEKLHRFLHGAGA